MGLDDAAFKEAQKNGEITAEVIKMLYLHLQMKSKINLMKFP